MQVVSSLEPVAAGRRNDSFVEAFAKGLQVIRAFPPGKGAVTLAELAQSAKLPRATTRRLVLTLVELGFASAQDDRFALTPRVMELGFTYLSSIPIYRRAQDVLDRLAAELNELCYLSVLDGAEAVLVVRVPGRDALSRNWGVGGRLPAYCTAMGRVLLAGVPRSERQAVLRTISLQRLTRKTVVDVEALDRLIEQAAADGFSMVEEEVDLGVIALAVPVKDRRGNVVASAGISFQPSRFTQKAALSECLPPLRIAARNISETLS